MVLQRGNITISDDFIITTPNPIKEPTEGIGCTIYTHMQNHTNQVAQIDARTGEEDTFGQLLQRCIRTALHLRDKNITRDHIVSLCTSNHLDTVVPYIAAQFLGAKVASLDTSFSQQEMLHLLKQIRPRILFITPESVPSIEKSVQDLCLDSEIVVFGETQKHTQFSDFLEPHWNEDEFNPVTINDLKETAVIHFSSGTTGLPKGICLSHHACIGQSLNITHTENPDHEYMKSQAERVSFPLTQLGYTSLYWVSASTMLLTSVIQGFCRLICPSFDAKEIWDFIEKYKPLVLMLTPVEAMEMLSHVRNVDVSSILSIIIVGSPISKEYCLKIRQVFPQADLARGYGQTEVCGVLTNFRGNDIFHRPLMKREDKIESVGLPLRGISYKVVDLDTNQNLGPNQRGELRVKSSFVMNGYYNMDSSDSFDESGWLKTGDVVYYDDDCCFYVVDRIKESFKYRGWFVAPALIENELLNHPAVKQAVVVGIPHEDGYHPMGLVVVRDGFGVSEEDLEKFVEERVPERQRLRAGVKFVKDLPLTVTGKVKRSEIKQMISEGLKNI